MGRSRSVLRVVAAAALAAGVAAGVWVAASRPGSPAAGPGPAVPSGSPVVARVPIAGKPRQLALSADGLWVITDRHLHRIDTSTNRVVASISVGSTTADPGGLGLLAKAAWVPGERSELLWRIDRAANRVSGRVRLGQPLYGPVEVAVQGHDLWVSCCALKYGTRPAGMLLRVDSRRNQVTGRIPVPEGPLAVAANRDAVWVGTARGSLLRVDPASATVVARVPPPNPGGRIQALSSRSGDLWVADTGAGAIRRFDPRSGRFTLEVAAPIPKSVAAGPDGAWVVTDLHQLLSWVDGRTGRRGRTIPLAQLGGVRGVVVGPDAVWVTTGNHVVRLDPARVPKPAR
jgi:DNA-binding beta-propeller fold protein YncE